MKTNINKNTKNNLKDVRKYNIKGLTSETGKYKMFIVRQEEKEQNGKSKN